MCIVHTKPLDTKRPFRCKDNQKFNNSYHFSKFFFLFSQNSVDLTLEGTMNLEGRGKR